MGEESLSRNWEAIEKLRAQIKVARDAEAAGISSMKCPRCDGSLRESKVEEVSIDTCDNCGGIWLDSGELEQLMEKEKSGWFGRLFTTES